MKEIIELIEEKKKKELNQEDTEKLNVIETLITNESLFFQIDMQTAYGILQFLGVKEEELSEYYTRLLSFENYSNISSVYVLDEELLNPQKEK